MNKKIVVVVLVILSCMTGGYIYYQSGLTDHDKLAIAEATQPLVLSSNLNPTLNTKPESPILVSEPELVSADKLQSASVPGSIVQCDLKSLEIELKNNDGIIDFMQSLGLSSSVDDQVAYSLFSPPTQGKIRLDLLKEFNQQFGDNKYVLMDLIGYCIGKIADKSCNQNLLDSAIAIEGDNGALWFKVASYHARRGDDQATQNAIKELIEAPFYDDYEFKYLELFMDAAKGAPKYNFSANAIIALGVNSSKPRWFGDISKFCGRPDQVNDQIADLCLNLGRILEQRSQALLLNNFGIQLQKRIYRAQYNEQAFLLLDQKSNLPSAMTSDAFNQAVGLSLFDPDLFQAWLNNLTEYGEEQAAKMLIEQAILLSSDQHYNPC